MKVINGIHFYDACSRSHPERSRCRDLTIGDGAACLS